MKSYKRKAAEELAGLRKDVFGSPGGAAIDSEFGARVLEMVIDLYEETYTEDALRGALDFYRSDIGQSVLRAEKELREKFPKRFSDLSKATAGRSGSELAELPPHKNE